MTTTDAPLHGKLTAPTRRDFIRGIAAAGATTAGAVASQSAGLHLFAEAAEAHGRSNFGDFAAIAASSDDSFQVPAGYRADVLISWGDVFRDGKGRPLHYGFNNDFLAYFPLAGSREGLLFVNHEYPDPFFLPTSGPNRGIAFRFANGPVECELTGPYFTPDGRSLFLNVQHPGETTGETSTAPGVFGEEATYTSWWPEGNRTTGANPSTPRPSTVVITRD